jgi:hypothetical protein
VTVVTAAVAGVVAAEAVTEAAGIAVTEHHTVQLLALQSHTAQHVSVAACRAVLLLLLLC